MTRIDSNWAEDDSRVYEELADTQYSAGINQAGIGPPTKSPASGRYSRAPSKTYATRWEIDTR